MMCVDKSTKVGAAPFPLDFPFPPCKYVHVYHPLIFCHLYNNFNYIFYSVSLTHTETHTKKEKHMSASMSHHSIPDYWSIFRLSPPLNKSKTKKFKFKKIYFGVSLIILLATNSASSWRSKSFRLGAWKWFVWSDLPLRVCKYWADTS